MKINKQEALLVGICEIQQEDGRIKYQNVYAVNITVNTYRYYFKRQGEWVEIYRNCSRRGIVTYTTEKYVLRVYSGIEYIEDNFNDVIYFGCKVYKNRVDAMDAIVAASVSKVENGKRRLI